MLMMLRFLVYEGREVREESEAVKLGSGGFKQNTSVPTWRHPGAIADPASLSQPAALKWCFKIS